MQIVLMMPATPNPSHIILILIRPYHVRRVQRGVYISLHIGRGTVHHLPLNLFSENVKLAPFFCRSSISFYL